MDFVKVDGDKLVISVSTKPCKNCSKPMVSWTESLPEWIMFYAKKSGLDVVKESYGDFGVCLNCISKGNFPRKCESCYKEKHYPKDFKYEITRYAKYPEDETEFYYICKECTRVFPSKVMDMLVDYDDAKDLEKV